MIESDFNIKSITNNFLDQPVLLNGREFVKSTNYNSYQKVKDIGSSHLSGRILPCMTRCTRAEFSAVYEDSNGNVYKLTAAFEGEGQESTEQNTTRDTDDKSDSWDHDYE